MVISPRKKKRTLTPDPFPSWRNKTHPDLFIFWVWWRQLWYWNVAGSLANLSSSHFLLTPPSPSHVHLGHPTIHQRRLVEGLLKSKTEILPVEVYLWSPLFWICRTSKGEKQQDCGTQKLQSLSDGLILILSHTVHCLNHSPGGV